MLYKASLLSEALLLSLQRNQNLQQMKAVEHNLPVTIDQILAWVRQCTVNEKKALLEELMGNTKSLMHASENSLAKDWLTKEEDEAWKDL